MSERAPLLRTRNLSKDFSSVIALQGNFAKGEVSRAEATQLMAGGAELDELAHELERDPARAAAQEP